MARGRDRRKGEQVERGLRWCCAVPFPLMSTSWCTEVEGKGESRRWAGALGVVGGPLGLPPPAVFPFFFVEKEKGEKRIGILGLFHSAIFY